MYSEKIEKLSTGANAADIFEAQKKFFQSEKTFDADFRIAQLEKLLSAILFNEKKIYEAVNADFNKSELESVLSESGLALKEIRFIKSKLRRWIKPKRVATQLINFLGYSKIYHVPYGNVLLINPWNYPFLLNFMSLAGSIAGGNVTIIKPSELVPNSSALLKEIIENIFEPNYVSVIEGDANLSKQLLELNFDFIFFTGSERVGKIVAQKAAETLTPFALELGGKSPALVTNNANIKIAAKRIAWGKFLNAGQTCVAPDYVLVDNSVKENFLYELIQAFECFGNKDYSMTVDYARIVNENHFDRLIQYLREGKIIYGGEHEREQNFISPTVIDEIDFDSPVMKEEIFGPILPVIGYDNFNEALKKIASLPPALAGYIFSESKHETDKFISTVKFGAGAVNDTIAQFGSQTIPLGGLANSGFGKYHGYESFNLFTHAKGIISKPTWLDLPIRYPPYSNWKKKIIELIYKKF